jgi:hypothetical protein
MPGPLDFLTTPLIPKGLIQGTQEALDAPALDRSIPIAQLRGLGAGLLEGVRRQTSPLNLASMAAPLAGRAASLGGKALGALRSLRPTIELVEDIPAVTQVMPSMDEVAGLTSQLAGRLKEIPRAGEALGAKVAEFTPRGAESLYNAGRRGLEAVKPVDPVEKAYQALIAKGGR